MGALTQALLNHLEKLTNRFPNVKKIVIKIWTKVNLKCSEYEFDFRNEWRETSTTQAT